MLAQKTKRPLTSGTVFCFTWKVEGTQEPCDALPPDCEYVYQKEKGSKTGYIHWQGYVKFAKVMTKGQIIAITKDCDWENRQGTHKQAYDYCTKLDTRVEVPVINMDAKRLGGKRSDLDIAAESIRSHRCWRDVVNDPTLYCVMKAYSKWVRMIFDHKPLPLSKRYVAMTKWQEDIMAVILEDPDDRTIFWIWSKDGLCGKSQTAKEMVLNYNALLIPGGAYKDIAYAYDNNPIVVFNYTRSHSEFMCYDAMESLKDGVLFSSKYESAAKVFSPPHVIVFANTPPEDGKLSADRLIVTEVFPLVEMKKIDDTSAPVRKRPRIEVPLLPLAAWEIPTDDVTLDWNNESVRELNSEDEFSEVPKFFINTSGEIERFVTPVVCPNPKINI